MVRQAVIAHQQLPNSKTCQLRNQYGLIELSIATNSFSLRQCCLEFARRRLVFDEFFYLQLGLLQRQHSTPDIQTSAVSLPPVN